MGADAQRLVTPLLDVETGPANPDRHARRPTLAFTCNTPARRYPWTTVRGEVKRMGHIPPSMLVSCIRSSSHHSEAFQKVWKTHSCLKRSDRSTLVGPLFPMNCRYTTLGTSFLSENDRLAAGRY